MRERALDEPFATEGLAAKLPSAASFASVASGVLAITIPFVAPIVLLWFRAEQIEVIEWAGNPHKASTLDPEAILNPRTSFEAWSETVRGRARRWSPTEIEAASRLRRAILDAGQGRQLRKLNRELRATLGDNESLLRQKNHLIREVSHRVQNSLQLVSSYLGLQALSAGDATLETHLAEAQRRLSAVGLVHRRLYRDDQVETVDLARYLEELCGEMAASMGDEWGGKIRLSLAPIPISADRAVYLGLILTELVINASKHAYGGVAGPLAVSLEQDGDRLRMVVADRGSGVSRSGDGFGMEMMGSLIEQLAGTIAYDGNDPGLRAIVTAPIA